MEEKEPTRSRNWVFTANNYTDLDISLIQSLCYTTSIKYCVIGKEGNDATPHLQGFICFKDARTLGGVRKILPLAHWEIKSKWSSFQQASDYCKKEGDFWEYGVLPMDQVGKGAAEKDRWSRMIGLASTRRLNDLRDEEPSAFVKYYGTWKKISKDYQVSPSDLDGCCGIWYWGVPGAGKSYAARHTFFPFYEKECNKWWDGYQEEPYVIIDEVEQDHGKFLGHFLKKWSDRYSFSAEIKGGKLQIRPLKIVVTSNYSLEEIFGHDQTLVTALKRRFTVKHFSVPFNLGMQQLQCDEVMEDDLNFIW